MDERKLATIQIIKNLIPIEGADKIVLAEFNSIGWKCIVQKDEFNIGDKCIYCEIDSVLPEENEQFEFLRKRCFIDNGLVKGIRIRTLKMKGTLSQGIVFSYSSLLSNFNKKFTEGNDVTDILKITKYESPEEMKTVVDNKPKRFWKRIIWTFKKLLPKESKKFPKWILQTDEIRVQSNPSSFKDNKNKIFYISEKIDGCSGSFAIKDNKFYVMSRNMIRKIEKIKGVFNFTKKFFPKLKYKGDNYVDNGVWEKIATQFNLKEKLSNLNRNIAIQGEIIGEGIQKNKYKLEKLDFYCFGAFDISTQKYLNYIELVELLKIIDIKIVPILSDNFILEKTIDIDSLINRANGMSVVNKEILREGLVYRLVDDKGSKISFKTISNNFLLKWEL